MKGTFICECDQLHPHKVINRRDYLALAKSYEYMNDDHVFIIREDCKFRQPNETVLARRGKLVLVRCPSVDGEGD